MTNQSEDKNSKLSSGSDVIDKLLNGGFDRGIITSVYGPAASGKTTMCLMASISASNQGKIFFIDSEGGFSVERLKQLTPNYKTVLKNLSLMKPTRFEEQEKVFDELNRLILNSKDSRYSLIVVDTISFLYRVEKDESNVHELNRRLGKQVNLLNEIARKKNIPVIMTNQVYADFSNKNNVKIVGGDIIKYASKCMIQLDNLKGNLRRITLIKHRSLPEKNLFFEIREKGFFEVSRRENKFKIF